MNTAWRHLTLPGRILFIALPLLVGLTVGLLVVIAVAGPVAIEIVSDNLPLFRFILAATIVLLMTVPTAFLIIYMEMKVIALINLRIGPDRVGPFGMALSVIHGLKVLAK